MVLLFSHVCKVTLMKALFVEVFVEECKFLVHSIPLLFLKGLVVGGADFALAHGRRMRRL